MIAWRSGSVSPPHWAISASVRPHPSHKPVMPLTMQILTQGVETERGAAASMAAGIRDKRARSQPDLLLHIEKRQEFIDKQ